MLLDRFHTLPSGLQVRLRLTRSSDRRAISALLERTGAAIEPLGLIRFDPRRQAVLCATALLDGRETVLGVGSIESGAARPDVVIADDRADEVRELLIGALTERASVLRSPRAA